MSEEDVREGLRDAVAGEPPLEFDPDALVTSARQQVKRRRALLAVGVATVTVVAAAVAVPIALGRGGTQVGAPPASATATSLSKSTAVPRPSDDYTAAELRRRGEQMRVHLEEFVPTVLPTASEFDFGEFGGEAAGQFYEGQTSVNAPVSFTVDGARYSILVTVWTPGAPSMSPDTVCDGSGYCERVGDGKLGPMVIKTEDLGDPTILTLYHFRTNGGVVQIAAYNYDMAAAQPPAYMPTVPVTIDQLTTLATDPDLGL